ncbi:MAG: hypothetical protein AABX90_02970 [Nanoarchaeota archaeon]
MKIAIVNKGKYSSVDLKKELKKSGFKIVNKNPDIVFSVGGDGTFFISERKSPGIPKVLVRDSKTSKLCTNEPSKTILKKIKNKDYKIEKLIKLQARNLIAVNDIIIRNKNQYEALRFNLKINNKKYKNEFIGDGIIISTPYGSSGYFSSITKKCFKEGNIGIAFNNSTCPVNPIIVKDNSVIEMKINRNVAIVSADNKHKTITLRPKSKIKIKKSNNCALVIKLN